MISGAFTVVAVGLTVFLTSRGQNEREERLWQQRKSDDELERQRAKYEGAAGVCNDVLKRVTHILVRCPSYPENEIGGKEIPEEVHIRAVDAILELNYIGFLLEDEIAKESVSSLADSAWVTLYAVREKPNRLLQGHADELQFRASVVGYQLGKLIVDPMITLSASDVPSFIQANPREPQSMA